MSDNQIAYTLFEFRKIPLLGSTRSNLILKRLVDEYNIPPQGKSDRDGNLYLKTDLEEALLKYQAKTGRSRVGSDDIENLRKRKLQQEVAELEKINITKDLQIEQLKSRLIDYEEVYQYLVIRKAVETALLKRLLFIQMPIEVPGLTIPKAREKAEIYYNELMQSLSETLSIWKKKYKITDTKIEKEIEDIVASKEKQ